MSNEPTLVILIPGFPPDKKDSTCLPAHQDLVVHINQQFPAVKLLIIAFQYPFQSKEYYWNGNKVIAFGGKNKGGISRRLVWWRIKRKLDALKKENKIAGVLTFWAGECGWVGKKWADKNGLPHYCWLMGQDARPGNKFIRKAGFIGDELIAISDFIREEMYTNYGLAISKVLPLGVSAKTFPVTKRNIDILCAGSLIPLKQYELAIETGAALKKDWPDFRMMLCGQGPEKERLSALIREQGLAENILLAGEKEHDELLGLMQQSKIFLHPSSYEGLGIVCLEALAAGTPVISFTRPMKEPIRHWYTVDSVEAMTKMAAGLLQVAPEHEPVCPFPIEQSAEKLMKLFGF